ncbi:MAG: type secretion system protein, partial [Gammaproteobacteria bacterium]|nr:type secretion system protein [Gammaproteobacteria bacterium]
MKIKNLFHPRISKTQMALFFRQLATLLQANIPIINSLNILREDKNNKPLHILITTLTHEITSGHTLAQCLNKFPRHFDHLSCHLIHVGEQSGTLVTMLQRIALHKEKILVIKNKFKQALFYPCIILLVSLVTSTIMLLIVIPRFAELFQSMHSTLPAFTNGVIHLSRLLRQYYWLFLFPTLGITLFWYRYQHSTKLQSATESFILTIPSINQLYSKIILARLSRSLATTFAAGVPISESLPTIASTTGSPLYRAAILKLRTQITKGQQLHQAMRKFTYFPPAFVQMVKIGEESGTLDKMLEKIADI